MAACTALAALFLLSLFNSTSSRAEDFRTETIAEGLAHPWSLAFLPDGSFLVTERGGTMQRISPDGQNRASIENVPVVVARNQGGLLDVVLDPDYDENRMIYFSYVGRGQGGHGTEVARAVLTMRNNRLSRIEKIFSAKPKMRSNVHFGSRLLVLPDDTLLVTLGDRYRRDDAQNPENHLGALVRIHKDGRIPDDNPFTEENGIKPDIYSFGHRNVQGIAQEPGTGRIWIIDHGPRGGDELHILQAGANYGWPEITYGIDYTGEIISDRTEAPGMQSPVTQWTPAIAPSGMAFYNGDRFPQWQGDLFIGSLVGRHLRRLEIEGDQVVAEHVYLEELGERIRDVRMGPDGYLYLLTDASNGRLIRLVPVQ